MGSTPVVSSVDGESYIQRDRKRYILERYIRYILDIGRDLPYEVTGCSNVAESHHGSE